MTFRYGMTLVTQRCFCTESHCFSLLRKDWPSADFFSQLSFRRTSA